MDIQGLFNVKSIVVEEQLKYYLTQSWGDKELNAYPKAKIS